MGEPRHHRPRLPLPHRADRSSWTACSNIGVVDKRPTSNITSPGGGPPAIGCAGHLSASSTGNSPTSPFSSKTRNTLCVYGLSHSLRQNGGVRFLYSTTRRGKY